MGDEELSLFPHAGDVYTMDSEMQRHYVHGILENSQRKDEEDRIRGVKGNRIALIFRSGNRLIVKDDHGELVSDLKGVVRLPIPTHVDHIPDLKVGECYTKQQLKDMGAHTNCPGGVSGRAKTGADAVCVSRNCPMVSEQSMYHEWACQKIPANMAFNPWLTLSICRCENTIGVPISCILRTVAKGLRLY